MTRNDADLRPNTSRQPLFFTNPQVISHDRHAQAKVCHPIDMGFARKTNFVPLVAKDILMAAKYYPLAFTLSDPIVPIAILGLEQENYFVDANNHWLHDHYIPAYVNKYPFAFTVTENQEMTLCIDEAVLVEEAESGGNPIYEKGKPSRFIQSAVDRCVEYHEEYQTVSDFCDTLIEWEMLSPHHSRVELKNKRMIHLDGFQLIEPNKIRALSKETIFDMFEKGHLAMIYYILQSQTNWKTLLDMAATLEAHNPSVKA